MLRGKWWEIYNDPELNALEDQLNINNQNIKQSFENFMEARTIVAQARSQLYPTIGTTPFVPTVSFLGECWQGVNGGGTGNHIRRSADPALHSSRSESPGSRIFGARFATPFTRRNTTRS